MKPSEGTRYRRAGIRIERNRWIGALEGIVRANPEMEKLVAMLVMEILKDTIEEHAEEAGQ